MASAVTIRDLTKSYGRIEALRGVSFDAQRGEIFGIIGPDGAGKTTLFRILTTLLLPDSGRATVDGLDVAADYKQIRRRVGYMPGRFSLYQDMSVEENLRFFATLFGTTIEANYDLIRDIYSQIEPFRTRRAGALSGGMKQRALIAQALLNNPEILILDEPTAGLDPKERIRIRNFISEIAEDKIVLISTHVVSDIEFIAKEIILLKQGKLVSHDTCQNLVNEIANKVVEMEIEKEELKYFQDNYRVSNLCHNDDKIVVRLVTDNPPENHKITIANPTLEDLYLYIFEQGM